MAPGGPDLHHVTLRASIPPATQGTMSTPDLATTVARGVAATATEILERFTQPPQVNEADCPPVDLVADMPQSWNASRDAWLPPHELRQLDKPLLVGHQLLTGWGTVPRPPKKKVSGRPVLK